MARREDPHDGFLQATTPHLDAVWSVARRLTDDRQAAEDVVQETFLRAYRSFAGQGRGQVRSWLVAIAVNVARSDHRRTLRRPAVAPGVGVDEAWPDPADTADLALGRVDRQLVADALAALPDAQRVALTLVDIGGLTTREAAEVEGVPLGTMLSRVHRGRRQLAAALRGAGLRAP